MAKSTQKKVKENDGMSDEALLMAIGKTNATGNAASLGRLIEGKVEDMEALKAFVKGLKEAKKLDAASALTKLKALMKKK